jgi:outer membrane protein OmpA-like peptidoglycan-associated protein
MSSQSQNGLIRSAVVRLAIRATMCSFVAVATAQDQSSPKWEIFGGYSFFYPNSDVHGMLSGGIVPVGSAIESNPRGAGISLTYDFSHWFGLTGDISGNLSSGESGVPSRIDDAEFHNLSIGPKITFRGHHFSPFLEALVGEHRLTSEVFGPDDKVGFMAGGGLDLNMGRHVALRLIRADYVFSNHQYGSSSTVPATNVRGARLQSGIVFMFGGGPVRPPFAASCSVNPIEVMPGDPAIATVSASNFNPHDTLSYVWSINHGQIAGTGETASINTSGLTAGSYAVTARITDLKMGKGSEASCMTQLAIKEPPRNLPTISCSANPATVQSGTPSKISCPCTSRDNIAVTVSNWTTSAGNVHSGSPGTTTLTTSGVPPGGITVSATCTDSRGLSATATANVMAENPPAISPEVAQLESRLALHSVYFPTDRPTIANPNHGLTVSQQKILLSLADYFIKYLQTKPDAHLTLEGHADPRGSVDYNQALSERRVENTKLFLLDHGIPEANIETKAFGEQDNLTKTQVEESLEKNPELTSVQRQNVLRNMQTILLASNRRVDITLSTTGQQSLREYPFNAADSLTLIKK